MQEGDPIKRFQVSLARALDSETFDATRAALATADARGRPSVRFVLVKGVDARGFVFYTNYESRKAQDLARNPFAALAFHWASTGEQVRIEGAVERIAEDESDAYFAVRPRGSQIGAWASAQSTVVPSREVLENKVAELTTTFGEAAVARPPFWGGYRIVPTAIEFWQDRADRLHDRALYTKSESGWEVSRLSP